MLIRPYVPSDFAAVTALWDATDISIHYNDPAKDIPRMLATHNCQLYVGTLDERVMASASWSATKAIAAGSTSWR